MIQYGVQLQMHPSCVCLSWYCCFCKAYVRRSGTQHLLERWRSLEAGFFLTGQWKVLSLVDEHRNGLMRSNAMIGWTYTMWVPWKQLRRNMSAMPNTATCITV